MLVLGIETSCDETAAALVENGRRVRSSIISSSLNLHKKYGGIIPEIAFRRQLETIAQVVDCALKESKTCIKDIGLISVTGQPGLTGSLLVGRSFAKALSMSTNIPLLEVDHLYSHIYAAFLNSKEKIKFPFIALVVSGGHTNLFYLKSFSQITLLGQTHDDACGEAFDKVAKILKLGYPGGPIIERTARSGDPKAIKFSCSNTKGTYDFSFSGIKTAVLYYVQKHKRLNNKLISDICASFQETALTALVAKTLLACQDKKVSSVVIGGGVAANTKLREKFTQETKEKCIRIILPEVKYCMDNAAMVAGLGYQLYS